MSFFKNFFKKNKEEIIEDIYEEKAEADVIEEATVTEDEVKEDIATE